MFNDSIMYQEAFHTFTLQIQLILIKTECESWTFETDCSELTALIVGNIIISDEMMYTHMNLGI